MKSFPFLQYFFIVLYSPVPVSSSDQNDHSVLKSVQPNHSYVLQDDEKAAKRLDLLCEDSNPSSQKFLLESHLGEKSRVLSLGCGICSLEIWMAKELFTEGHVTAVDFNQKFLDIAHQRAESAGVRNITFIQKNINEIDWAEQFDFVYCRFLLEHLQEPLKALKIILNALKEGGTVVVEDDEMSANKTDPTHSSYQKAIELAGKAAAGLGVNYDIGRQLKTMLQSQGAYILRAKSEYREITGNSRYLFEETIKEARLKLVTEGIVTQGEIDWALKGVKEVSRGEYKIYEMLHQVHAKKSNIWL